MKTHAETTYMKEQEPGFGGTRAFARLKAEIGRVHWSISSDTVRAETTP